MKLRTLSFFTPIYYSDQGIFGPGQLLYQPFEKVLEGIYVAQSFLRTFAPQLTDSL